MEKIFTLILALFFCSLLLENISAQCPDSNISLQTQGQVDSFSINYPNCYNLTNNLRIGALYPNDATDITDLSGLIDITQIGGGLSIYRNPHLATLEGLENITHVETGLTISYNPRLKNITPLSDAFSTTEGWLSIMGNDSLENIAAITGASFFNVEISDNNNLQYLTDSSFTKISTANVVIANNPNLSSLYGLNNIEMAYSVVINNNDSLLHLNGLNNLREIWWYGLRIIGNDALLDLQGLESLKEASYTPESQSDPTQTDIVITGNNALQSLEGMGIPINGYSLDIINNDALVDLHGLENQPINKLAVIGNDALLNLTGFTLGSAAYGHLTLTITQNPLLEDLHGLEAFERFDGLHLEGNDMLMSLNGIDSIKKIWTLKISNNDILETLDGLGTAETIIDNISIHSNPLLSKCHVESICNMLSTHPLEVGMLNNTFGCNTRDEVLDSCMIIIATEDVFESSTVIQLSPNPAFSHFDIKFLDKSQGKLEDVRIFDGLGKLVYTEKMNSLSHRVDVSQWQKGLYLVLVNAQFLEKILVK